ncbi:MAG: hypothetical protein DDT33_01584 [Firmicutes bacterium]|nr:hypothetical protein [Bacillota bacterium]
MIKRLYRKLFTDHSALQGYVAHIPHGIVNVFLAVYVCWSVALLFGGGYIVMQYWQKFQGHPVDANDVAGWMVGMVIGSVIYITVL